MTTPKTPATTQRYADAYAKLEAIAQRLRTSSGATSIDSLVDDVKMAREAFAICKARLSSIRDAIDTEIAAAQDSATA